MGRPKGAKNKATILREHAEAQARIQRIMAEEDQPEVFFCVTCHKKFTRQKDNFYPSQSQLWAGNNHFMPSCKSCVEMPNITPEEIDQLDIFTLLTLEEGTRADVISALGFFISEPVEYEPTHQCFLVNPAKDEAGAFTVDGIINAKNWTLVCDVCLQCAYIDPPKEKKEHKYKDERTRKKFEEFYRKKAEYEKNQRGGKKADPDYELANIISALATYHDSLNKSGAENAKLEEPQLGDDTDGVMHPNDMEE